MILCEFKGGNGVFITKIVNGYPTSVPEVLGRGNFFSLIIKIKQPEEHY